MTIGGAAMTLNWCTRKPDEPKDNAAKRSSLDLTRALSYLRNGGKKA